MSRITHVCLSDLHLGAETSLLTEIDGMGEPDPGRRSPVLAALAECLRSLLPASPNEPRPTLVLAGDILELAFAQTRAAAMGFERLLSELFPAERDDLFGPEILFVPGNHDHALWQGARARHYADFVRASSEPLLGSPWHITRMIRAPEAIVDWPTEPLLDALAARHQRASGRAQALVIRVVYPNLGLLSASGDRAVVVTHGHFIEPIYQVMSKLESMIFPEQPPATSVDEIEQQNCAWVDFFSSTMGCSGSAGEGMQRFHELLDHEASAVALRERLAKGVVKTWFNDNWLPDLIEMRTIGKLLAKFGKRVASRERADASGTLGERSRMGLSAYIDGPLHHQILHERRHASMPDTLTLVFGHTHKPFEERRGSSKFAKPVEIINTGGWVVDTVDRHVRHGAAIVVIDEAMNCASLRMFDEPKRGAEPKPVRVAPAADDLAHDHELARELRARISADERPWKHFAEAIGTGVELRAEALARRSRAD